MTELCVWECVCFTKQKCVFLLPLQRVTDTDVCTPLHTSPSGVTFTTGPEVWTTTVTILY